MKKILFIAVAFLGVLFVSSCSNEEEERERIITNKYDYVGQLHNAALDYVFKTHIPTRTGIEGNNPGEVLTGDIEEYLTTLLTTDPRFDISPYCEVNVEEEIDDAMSDANSHMRTPTSLALSDIPTNVTSMIDDVEMSDDAKDELDEIYQSFSTYSGVTLASYLSNKENAIAFSSFDDYEKAVLLSALSVATNSFDYWDEVEFGNGLSGKNVAKADFVGAIRGAWRGKVKIAFCTMVGGWAAGAMAAARYIIVQSAIDSAVYAFIESNMGVTGGGLIGGGDGPMRP